MKYLIAIASLALFVLMVWLTGCSLVEQDEGGRIPLVDGINAVRAANIASAAVNAYALPIEAVLGTLTAVVTAYAIAKRKQQITTNKKYTAHKRAVEADMRAGCEEDAEVMYNRIGEERKKLGL